MAQNLATLEAVTKEVYEGSLNEQLNSEVVALKRIERSSEGVTSHVGGRYVRFPIHTRRNQGIGARGEGQALPRAGRQGTAAAQLGLRYQYGSVELTGQAIELIDKDYQSFISALELEMNGLKTDLGVDLNRQVYGSNSGAIGTVVSGSSGTTVEVDRPELFQLDMILDYYPANAVPGTTNPTAQNIVVENIDLDAGTIELNGAQTVAAGGIFVRHGAFGHEWTGLDSIVDDTSELYGIDPANEPVWTANIMDNGGTDRAVSESLFTLMADTINTRGTKPTVILTTKGVRRAYANLLMQQRQYHNVKDFTGGFSGIGFVTDTGEIPIVTDGACPKGSAYFLDEKNIKLYRDKDWSFLDRDGNKWKQKVDSDGRYDVWEATMYQYSELGTHRRNAHGVIKDITEE